LPASAYRHHCRASYRSRPDPDYSREVSDPKISSLETDPPKPDPQDGKQSPEEQPSSNTGSGAASALARLKVWERSRAKLREGGRDKPGNKVGGGGN
jgi:hypothetical protein